MCNHKSGGGGGDLLLFPLPGKWGGGASAPLPPPPCFYAYVNAMYGSQYSVKMLLGRTMLVLPVVHRAPRRLPLQYDIVCCDAAWCHALFVVTRCIVQSPHSAHEIGIDGALQRGKHPKICMA